MTKLQQLQRMVEVTPVLRDYAPKVTYTRGQGYHVHRNDGMNTLWFVTFEVGQAYLSAWIGSNRQPSLANIRQGVKHGVAAHPVKSDPQTSVPMPTGDLSWRILQLHTALLGTVTETFNRVINGDSSLSWQAIGALTRMEMFFRDELERAGIQMSADAWADRRMAADNAWALSVGVTPDPVPTPTGESDEDYDEHPYEEEWDGFGNEPNDDPADDYGAAYPIHDDSWAYLEGEECNMCGKERTLNEKGYCASCWTIWNG